MIEAIGVPATFPLRQDLIAPGGVIANIGGHGQTVDLHLERLWSRNIAITIGVPRRHRYYQSPKTSGVENGIHLLVRAPVPTSLLHVRSNAAEISAPAWSHIEPRHPRLFQSRSIAGSPRFLENPSPTFAPLSDPGQFRPPGHDGEPDAVPANGTAKTPTLR